MVTVGQRVSTLPLVVEVDPEFRDRAAGQPDGHASSGRASGPPATEPEARDAARAARLADLLPSAPHPRRASSSTWPPARSAVSGMSAASGDAIPGDALYGVKRSTEQAQLALAGSDVSRGQLHLEFARTRLAEAGALGSDPAGSTRCSTTWTPSMRGGSQAAHHGRRRARRRRPRLQAIEQFADEQRPSHGQPGQPARAARPRAAPPSRWPCWTRSTERAAALQQTVACPRHDGRRSTSSGAQPAVCTTAGPPAAARRPAARRRRPPPAAPAPAHRPRPAGRGDRRPDATPPVEAGSPSAPARRVGRGAPTSGVVDSIEEALGEPVRLTSRIA